jgi:hypothetical protein
MPVLFGAYICKTQKKKQPRAVLPNRPRADFAVFQHRPKKMAQADLHPRFANIFSMYFNIKLYISFIYLPGELDTHTFTILVYSRSYDTIYILALRYASIK